MTKGKPCTFHNAKTNWSYFHKLLITPFDNSILLKTDGDIICAIESFDHVTQQATSVYVTRTYTNLNINIEYSSAIKNRLTETANRKKETM
jgi:hypothetical protein